jgi:hypothetical protein
MGEDENRLCLEQSFQHATCERNDAATWEKTKIDYV